MKKIKFLTSVFAAAALLAACDNSALGTAEGNEGSIRISFKVPEATRAAAQGNEAVISDIQVLLFDGSDNLYKYYSFDAGEVSAQSATISNILNGGYTAYVVANGPDLREYTTKSAFLAADIDLDEFNSPASDFVMEGSDDVTVSGTGTTDLSVDISRYVSRVVLKKVTNGLPSAYGALTVERVFLSNVVRVQEISGEMDPGSTPGNWYNKEGRKDEATRNAGHIIDGANYTASAAVMTFAEMAQNIPAGGNWSGSKYFYAYPNSATAMPDGFKEPFAAQRSVLVIVGTFGGRTYYYPVVLRNGLVRNTSYEVEATITGAGSDDPNNPVTTGSISVTITVNDWEDGTSYTESF